MEFRRCSSYLLADILANYDFPADSKLMEDAERARHLVIEHGLLKYNLHDITDSAAHYRIKTRRRVLVIGPVDTEATVRMGNPDKRSEERREGQGCVSTGRYGVVA